MAWRWWSDVRSSFFTASDFKDGDSEQHLSIYWGKLSAYPSIARLNIVRYLLSNELDINPEHSNGYDIWNIPEESQIKEGVREVDYYIRLLSRPEYLERVDISRTKTFWLMRNEWNDVVIVDAATDSWLVMQWYTTA